jgi:ribA/ribD-fused uncharacterized protein
MAIDSFRGEYEFLSNFYVEENGMTAEHWFQALKAAGNGEQAAWVLDSPTPKEAKRRGRLVDLHPDWEDIKIGGMETVLRMKFSNPELKHKLLKTGDEELIEGNWWGDTFWGVCNGVGRNELGKLLMKLREEYRNGL